MYGLGSFIVLPSITIACIEEDVLSFVGVLDDAPLVHSFDYERQFPV
jgi:hypothetical protein